MRSYLEAPCKRQRPTRLPVHLLADMIALSFPAYILLLQLVLPELMYSRVLCLPAGHRGVGQSLDRPGLQISPHQISRGWHRLCLGHSRYVCTLHRSISKQAYANLDLFLVLISSSASVIFIGQVISPERKVLALYPVFFFYTFLAWMVLIQ